MSEVPSPSTSPPPPQTYHIAIPPPELTQNVALIDSLVQLINTVYTTAEAGIFSTDYTRTNPAEIAHYLTNNHLALASNNPSSPWSAPENIQGCIRIMPLSATEGELAMLVASPASRGTGLGKQLIAFGEERCRAWGMGVARLDLLVPTGFAHELKSWVQPWYERLGYRVVGVTDFAVAYPEIARTVVTPCEYRMFRKVL